MLASEHIGRTAMPKFVIEREIPGCGVDPLGYLHHGDLPPDARKLGLGAVGVTASPLPGPAGNVEYFLWLRLGAPPVDLAEVRRAVEEGPS